MKSPFIKPDGITVAELRELLREWPDNDHNGEPNQVWVMTGTGTSSPCCESWRLNEASILLGPAQL